MPPRGFLLDIVEGAYDADCSDQEWLERAARRFADHVEGGVRPYAYTLAKTPDGPPAFPASFLPDAPDAREFFDWITQAVDPVLAEVLFPTGTSATLVSEMIAALSHSRGTSARTEGLKWLATVCKRWFDAEDLFSAVSVDAAGRGVVVGVATRGARIPQAEREAYGRVAVHLAAGYRLRRALPGAEALEQAEAIFEADGKLAHARGRATEGDMRSRLKEAVARVDRARTNPVREDDVTALELWQGLVEGRWSLVDRYDTDGRRYYVAVANPPMGVEDRALTELEAQVAAQVVAGEPNKVIAYSLGIGESTVAVSLANAMKKLGARSRIELVRLGRSLGS